MMVIKSVHLHFVSNLVENDSVFTSEYDDNDYCVIYSFYQIQNASVSPMTLIFGFELQLVTLRNYSRLGAQK